MSNIIILMSDEHNPFYSSVYGNQVVQTPNMERLAAQGTVFENAYCISPLYMLRGEVVSIDRHPREGGNQRWILANGMRE